MTYAVLLLDRRLSEAPSTLRRALQSVATWPAPVLNVFDFASQVLDAFRALQRARHIGKVVLSCGGRDVLITEAERP